MKRIFVLIIGIAISIPSFADQASREAAARELMQAMDIQGQMEKSLEIIRQAMPQQMQQNMKMMGKTNQMSDVAIASFSNTFNQTLSSIFEGPEWKNMENEFALIYAEVFTEEEMKPLIDFFNSPAGKSFLEKQPEVMRRSMALNQKMMMTIMPRLQQQLQKAESAKAPPPPEAVK